MSDLTRRVLEAQKRRETLFDSPGIKEDGDTLYAFHRAGDAMMNAAPALARQVEAMEALADRLEAEGTAGVRVPNRTPHDSGWHDSQIIAATRIRDALNVTD